MLRHNEIMARVVLAALQLATMTLQIQGQVTVLPIVVQALERTRALVQVMQRGPAALVHVDQGLVVQTLERTRVLAPVLRLAAAALVRVDQDLVHRSARGFGSAMSGSKCV